MALYRTNGYFLVHASETVYLNHGTIPRSVAFVAECVLGQWFTLEGQPIHCSIGIIQEINENNN